MAALARARLALAAALSLVLAAPAGAQLASKCTAAKYKAAAKYASAQVGCRSKAVTKDDPVDPDCEARARAKLATAVAKAEAKADCLTSGDGSQVEALADAFVADLADLLQPPVCCANNSVCLWVRDAASCLVRSGTLGPPGSVCDGAGECVAPPAAPGACCQDFVSGGTPIGCATGFLTPTDCGLLGGTMGPTPAVCLPTGVCQ